VHSKSIFGPTSVSSLETYWSDKIADVIKSAQIHILMFSPEFIALDYIFKHELPAINDKFANGDMVLPVIIKRCAWSSFVGEQLEAVPIDPTGRVLPVFEWQLPQDGFNAVRDQIGAILQRGSTRRVLPSRRSRRLIATSTQTCGNYRRHSDFEFKVTRSMCCLSKQTSPILIQPRTFMPS
jgi:hypothetical protein